MSRDIIIEGEEGKVANLPVTLEPNLGGHLLFSNLAAAQGTVIC